MAKPALAADPVAALRDQALAAEQARGGQQVTWTHTAKDAPVGRRASILFTGVVGDKRYYAFAGEDEREQFAYSRNDVLFSVSRDVRAQLGLSAPVFRGTVAAAAPPPPPRKSRFRK